MMVNTKQPARPMLDRETLRRAKECRCKAATLNGDYVDADMLADDGPGMGSWLSKALGGILGGGKQQQPAPQPTPQVGQVPQVASGLDFGSILRGVGDILNATRTNPIGTPIIEQPAPAAPPVIVTGGQGATQKAGIDTNTLLIGGGVLLAAVVLMRK